MAYESPYTALQRLLREAKLEVERGEQEIALLETRINQYNAVIAARPAGIPSDWEPVLDQAGHVKGWMEPHFASRSVRA